MLPTKTDYIIVGQGIAGTVLALTLLGQGKKVLVVNNSHSGSSSKVAAGIFNPVTGKRLAKTWQGDLIFPFLHQFYRQMEQLLQVPLIYSKNIYRPFLSIEEQNAWTAKTASPELIQYTHTDFDTAVYSGIRNPYGGLEITQSGYVDVPVLLAAAKLYLEQHHSLAERVFAYEDIVLQNNSISWQGIQAKKILFCEGTFISENPYFNWLPFNNVKGELLTVWISGLLSKNIITRGVFVLPLTDNLYKVGATYQWDNLNWEISRQARQELEEKLAGLIELPFETIDQQAGIRPASLDRRPFIGLHPEIESLGVFNGLGTKGISLAPYYASEFCKHLEEGKELDKETHINRYFSLYYKSNTLNNHLF